MAQRGLGAGTDGKAAAQLRGRPPVPTLVRRVLCGAAGRERGAPRGRRFVMRWWRAASAVAVGAAAVVWACGGAGSGDVGPGRDGGPPPTDGGDPDAGPPDAGPPDAGPDAGPADAGPADAGPADGGSFAGPSPWPLGNTTYGSTDGIQEGRVVGTSTDEKQNLWVATNAALYLMKPGNKSF